MAVMEDGMRHFYARALLAKENKLKPEIVDNYMLKAIEVAALAAPYRHPRLKAVTLASDPNNPLRIKDDATADELRAEIMRRLVILRDAGVIDLEALPAPKRKIAN